MNKTSELLSDIINKNLCEGDEEFVKSKVYKVTDKIMRERYDIITQKQADYYRKSIGRYELFTIPNPLTMLKNESDLIIEKLVVVLKSLLGKINTKSKILIVGLGNRHISADSLGTEICKKINVTLNNTHYPHVMAICPSVMGLTGIETYDIVSGVIDKVKPTHLILLDSLCASDESRLCKSIQISNTGVCPGSGIGNNRKCIDKSLAPNVVSIGVPLLIYASTFMTSIFNKYDINISRINSIMHSIIKSPNEEALFELLNSLKTILKDYDSDTIVAEKDVDECVEILSDIIARAINISLNVSELK